MVFQRLQLEIFEKSWHISLFPPDITIGFDSDALSIFKACFQGPHAEPIMGHPLLLSIYLISLKVE